MTSKDRQIQDLKRENTGLREELQTIVEAMAACQFCKHADANCERWSPACKPVWRGLKR